MHERNPNSLNTIAWSSYDLIDGLNRKDLLEKAIPVIVETLSDPIFKNFMASYRTTPENIANSIELFNPENFKQLTNDQRVQILNDVILSERAVDLLFDFPDKETLIRLISSWRTTIVNTII